MVTCTWLRGIFIPLLFFGAYAIMPSEAGAQATPLPLVPANLSPTLKESLTKTRTNLDERIQAYRARKAAYDQMCSVVPLDATATINACKAEYAAIMPVAAALQKDKAGFIATIAGLVEPPVPVIDEEAEFYKDPIGWRERAELRVRHAVFLQKKWTAAILKNIEARTPPPSTKFAELSAGDVLLVSPVSLMKDPKEYLKGHAIALGDREIRALTAFAKGDLLAEITTRTEDLSHTLTFIREVNGRKFFLDHDMKGTVVIDDRQFLKEYGERGMMVARPLEVVDGRDLWQAAKDLALNQRGYGITGDRVVCSEMCAIAVARATKANYSGGNLGPIDVTPADFYDKKGNVGKHFVVTRLTITPAPEKK